jgi:hypothetical protein
LAGGTFTILVGAASLTGFAISTRADPTPGCPPLNPIAKRYVDRKTVCRRARREVLHSIKTGKDPDWSELFRSPEPSDRPRRHRKLRNGHHEASKHAPQPRRRHDETRSAGPSHRRLSGQTHGTLSHPRPRTNSAMPPTTVADHPTISHQTRGEGHDGSPSVLAWAGIAGLLSLLCGAAALTIRRPNVILGRAMKARRARLRRATRKVAPASTATDSHSNDPFIWNRAALAGPGAEDAVRYMAMDVLTSRRSDPIELILNRADAWRLLGIGTDDLRAERIPGLTLTDGSQQALAYLAHPGFSRRLLIAYAGESDDLERLLVRQNGRLAAIFLSSWAEPSVHVSANGEITPSSGHPLTASERPARLSILARDDARDEIPSLPSTAFSGGSR